LQKPYFWSDILFTWWLPY